MAKLRWSLLFWTIAITALSKGIRADDPDERTTAASDYDYYGREDGTDSDLEYRDLELVEEMKDESLVSGAKVQFRCRVNWNPDRPVTFTWYKGSQKLNTGDDERITIKDRSWGSRLQILDVYTADSGSYRCEASDGEKSVATSAQLSVEFSKPPESGGVDLDTSIFEGKCEIYAGYACAKYLKGRHIYVESFQKQTQMEQQITAALTLVGNKEKVSEKCRTFAQPAFCHFVFPLCELSSDEVEDDDISYEDEEYDFSYTGSVVESDETPPEEEQLATAIKLCREDCELLKHDQCANEFATDDELIKQLVKTADCSRLPRTTATGAKCTRLGLKSVVDNTHVCYNDTGTKYMGVVGTSSSGEKCRTWPTKMLFEYPELSGGHNFCRNPGNTMDQPWCYVDRDRVLKEPCGIPKCKSQAAGGTSDLVMILIPCVSIPVLIGCILLVMCFVCKKGKSKDSKHQMGKKVEMKSLSVKKTQTLELNPNLVHFNMELGEGKFGKVYKATIVTNGQWCPQEPVAAKTLAPGALPMQVNDFQREMEVFSELQHPNVSCMKAAVLQPNMRCMIFEYTSRVDLHEYLTLHNPNSDVGGGKVASSASSHTSNSLESSDFLHMAVQIASGLEYLASRSFVHRDLAARNVLVCSNNVTKISNLGVVRDCYLTSYYRSPQGGHMLPIRWMAPESLNGNHFSEKSVVWSFGVLIWEMFSYGLQPYCGYNNHEVIDMITRGQTLSCPDQCSARVYSLMRECWSGDVSQRPTCKDIHAKLSGWEGSSTTRMTSQLAQGIHQQLANVMRDGGHMGQYTPVQGVMIDGFNNPQYVTSPPQPGAPHVSPASQPYYTSPSATSSSGLNSPHPPTYPTYMQNPNSYPTPQGFQPQMQYNRPQASYPYKTSNTHSSSRSSDSCASSVRTPYPNQVTHGDPGQLGLQQHYPPPQNQMLQHTQVIKQPQYENLQRTPDSGVHSAKDGQTPLEIKSISPTPISIQNRPRPGSEVLPSSPERSQLSVYSNASSGGTAQSQPLMKPPAVAPKPPISPADPNRLRDKVGIGAQRNRNHNNHIDSVGDVRLNSGESQYVNTSPVRPQSGKMGVRVTSPVKHLEGNEKQRNSAANGEQYSGKAMSCDSGLPGDEPDTEPNENQPFLGKMNNTAVGYRPGGALLMPPGSSSSSVSGCTAVTAESRLTA